MEVLFNLTKEEAKEVKSVINTVIDRHKLNEIKSIKSAESAAVALAITEFRTLGYGKDFKVAPGKPIKDEKYESVEFKINLNENTIKNLDEEAKKLNIDSREEALTTILSEFKKAIQSGEYDRRTEFDSPVIRQLKDEFPGIPEDQLVEHAIRIRNRI